MSRVMVGDVPDEPEPGAAGDLSRFAGVYAWPDRRVEVIATRGRLLINNERGESRVGGWFHS
jgi:hypothetical protein